MGRFLSFFSSFNRIFKILPLDLRLRTLALFLWMVLQGLCEIFFLLTLTYMGMSLTAHEALRSELVFRGLFALSPALEMWVNSPQRLLLLAGAIVILSSVLKSLVTWIVTARTALLSEDISINIAKEIMSRFLHMNYAWHLSGESASTFERMMWRNNITYMLTALLSVYSSILIVLFLFLSLVGQEPVLTTLIIGLVGFVGIALYKFMRTNVDKNAGKALESSQAETRALMCATNGIRDVLIYRQQSVFLDAIENGARVGRLPRAFNSMASSVPTWVLETTGFIVVILAIVYLLYVEHADIPRVSVALGLLMLTAWRVLPYCNRVVGYQVTIRALRPMAEAVVELLEQLRSTPSDPPPAPDPNFTFKESIRFNHVSFSYAGAQDCSLRDISFEIRQGQNVGLIGASGSGKSTLAGILSSLLPPSEGEICVDGEPMTPERAAAFAAMIGYVPQHPFLFAGTLAENVAFSEWGKPVDEEKVATACKKAAIDFYQEHPQGLNMPIGENGSGLSGGQAQRVSIARALYSNPRLIIFDEATSSLDQANEMNIQQTIEKLANDVTCVIIAHRLTTVQKCDCLIWLDHGQIVMQGETETVLAAYNVAQHGQQ